MFQDAFALTIFFDDGLEPSSGEGPWLNVLVLARVPDMLHKPDVVGDSCEYRIDGNVSVRCADLLSVRTQFDQIRQQNLDHVVESRASNSGNVLNKMATVGGNGCSQ